MTFGPELLLIGAVAAVGVLHTVVPDHWVPITMIARQRGWSMAETARASLIAGTGHVVSTLVIALVVWIAGVAVATRFGQIVDTAASIALVLFGGWIAISAGSAEVLGLVSQLPQVGIGGKRTGLRHDELLPQAPGVRTSG